MTGIRSGTMETFLTIAGGVGIGLGLRAGLGLGAGLGLRAGLGLGAIVRGLVGCPTVRILLSTITQLAGVAATVPAEVAGLGEFLAGALLSIAT